MSTESPYIEPPSLPVRRAVVSDAASGEQGEPVISVRGLGKRYDIYRRNLDWAKDALTGSNKRARAFWALREINFDVHRGDAVGIVGRNGSGKSTLMQIIAGTLAPTEGEVHVRGRIAALLELGSGFNPQFTGQENIYLAGAILGFSRRQMEEKFDAIAAFAEIGEFMEQPIEVYSSGMHARLAFAVASTVEPEILILDEILSVGDAGFQQKCIGRLQQMLDSGVTLLFVSHSADAVKSICNKAVFLKEGRQECFGAASDTVDRYIQFIREGNTQRALQAVPVLAEAKVVPASASPVEKESDAADAPQPVGAARYGTGHGRVSGVRVLDSDGRAREDFGFGETITVEVTIEAVVDLNSLDVILFVRDEFGIQIFGASARDQGANLRELQAGERAIVRFTFDNSLRHGPHGICITFGRRPDSRGLGMVTLDHLDGCAAFRTLAPERGAVRGKVQWPVKASCEVLSRESVKARS